jgi:hypothetical protein
MVLRHSVWSSLLRCVLLWLALLTLRLLLSGPLLCFALSLFALSLLLCGALLCFALSLFMLGLFTLGLLLCGALLCSALSLRTLGMLLLSIYARLAGILSWLWLWLCASWCWCLWSTVGSGTSRKFGHGRILLHIIDGNTGAEGQILAAGRVRNQAEWGYAFWTSCRSARARLDLGGYRMDITLRTPSCAPVGSFAGVQRSCGSWIQRSIWITILSLLRLCRGSRLS